MLPPSQVGNATYINCLLLLSRNIVLFQNTFHGSQPFVHNCSGYAEFMTIKYNKKKRFPTILLRSIYDNQIQQQEKEVFQPDYYATFMAIQYNYKKKDVFQPDYYLTFMTIKQPHTTQYITKRRLSSRLKISTYQLWQSNTTARRLSTTITTKTSTTSTTTATTIPTPPS